MKKIFLIVGILLATTSFAEEYQIQTIGVAGRYNDSIYKSDKEIIPMPLINLNYNRFFIKGFKPGFVLYQEPSFKFSVIVDPLGGYFDGWAVDGKDMDKGYENIEDRDSQFMYGLDIDFDFSENVLGNINYMFGEDGSRGEISMTYVQYLTDRIVVLPTLNARYYSSDYVDYYVGVSEKEVMTNSKLDKEYEGKDSFSVGVSLTTEISLTEQFIMSFFAGYDYFDKEITDSPLVDKDGQIYYGTGFRFSF